MGLRSEALINLHAVIIPRRPRPVRRAGDAALP